MRTSKIIVTLLVLGALATGCVRKTKVDDPVPAPVAGKGGNATLRITPERREKNIDSCLIYLKYNAVTMPSPAQFDDSLWVSPADGRPIAEFDKLKQGNYYMYAIGWDTDIADTVLGGAAFKVVDTNVRTYNTYLTVKQILR